MTLTSALRASAVLLAVVAAIDPAWTSNRRSPLPIEVRAADISDETSAEDVRRKLRDMDDVAVNGSANPATVVVVGQGPIESFPSDIPVSVVTRHAGPNVAIDDVVVPVLMLTGLTARIEATVSATGMSGNSSHIALELDGIELTAVEHRWSREAETYTARFDHVPPGAGVGVIRIVARPGEREVLTGDNHADRQVIVEDRPLRVLVHEPRPSWAATFIRRVLEGDPVFEPTGLTRPSRGISASVGTPPAQISASALERFDVVIVGAPEELRQNELTALDEFSQRRGGTVVFVPDRRPSGPYAARLPMRFDEALVSTPVALQGTIPPMKGSEFITVVDPPSGIDTLAALPGPKGPARSERSESKGSVPVIVSWPTGAGQTIFSGALDAWRYRTADDGFARFWKAQIAQAAARSPRAVEIKLDPAPAAPGEVVTVRARLRPTEFEVRGTSTQLPGVSGRVVAADGSATPVRLWPTAETGVFEGRFRAPQAGRHVVEVRAAALSASQPLIVAAGSRRPHPESPASLRQLAVATGGVVVSPLDLSPLKTFVAPIPRPLVAAAIHPARSIAWMLAFILLLSAEWWLRRRRGHA